MFTELLTRLLAALLALITYLVPTLLDGCCLRRVESVIAAPHHSCLGRCIQGRFRTQPSVLESPGMR